MPGILEIDGSFGEGGGQILRTSLALSLVTRIPFRISNIRAGRHKPGLRHQHLTSVQAAAQIGQADVKGDTIGSQELHFASKTILSGHHQFSVGTAGSCLLVLQAVLPALLTAEAETTLTLEGGTHNPWAPPFDFLAKTFLPLVCRMGPKITATLDRPGFYPVGGGRVHFAVKPTSALSRIDLRERGDIRRKSVCARVARLPRHIAERELQIIGSDLGLDHKSLHVEEITESRGPGNIVLVEIESEHVTEVFTGFGRRGVPAEKIAHEIAAQAQAYIESGVPVGRHLADQLIIPMALSGGGKFRTLSLSAHSATNIEVVKRFLELTVGVSQVSDDVFEIDISSRI